MRLFNDEINAYVEAIKQDLLDQERIRILNENLNKQQIGAEIRKNAFMMHDPHINKTETPFRQVIKTPQDPQTKCSFCDDYLMTRNPHYYENYVYEFVYAQNLNSDWPTALYSRHSHERCFIKYVGKSYYQKMLNKTKTAFLCQECGEEIKFKDLGTEMARIYKNRITDIEREWFTTEADLLFCISCWYNMAGENFFNK